MSRRAVIVDGFPEEADLVQLERYFHRQGASVERDGLVRFDHDDRVCVRFISTDVCQGVLFYGNHVCRVNGREVALQVIACPADVEHTCLPPCQPPKTNTFVFGAKSLSPTGKISSSHVLWRSASTPNLATGPSCRVLVQGIARNMTKDTLTLLFESQTDSGGGDVKDISYNPDTGNAEVQFDKAEVAQRVLQRPTLQFQGSTMQLSSLDEEEEDGKEEEEETIPSSSTVMISGFGLNTGKELLSMYLENSKRSGGGEIRDIAVDQSSRKAYVTFKKPSVAERVSKRSNLQLSGHSLNVSLCQSDEDSLGSHPATMPHRRSTSGDGSTPVRMRHKSDMGESCAVVVEVPPDDPSVTEEYLVQHFQNQFRSGGGEVKNVYIDPTTGYYTVTFINPEVISRVLGRTHKIGTTQIKVTSIPPQAHDIPLMSGQQDTKRVYVHGLTPNINTIALTDYLKEGAACWVKDWTYNMDATTCLVEFGKPIDFLKLLRHMRQYPLCGVMLGLDRVSRSNQLQVDNIGDVTDQALELYFESTQRSGCGEDTKVKFNRDQGYAIITCMSPEVAVQASTRDHTLFGHKLEVALYYPGIGVIPPGTDTKSQNRSPASFIVSGLKPEILEFVKNSKKAKKKIDKLMEEAGGQLDWSHKSDGEVKVHHVLSVADTGFRRNSQAWEDRAKTVMVKFMEQFQCENIKLSTEIALKVQTTLSKERLDLDEISLSRTQYGITLVGVNDKVKEMVQRAGVIKQMAEEETNTKTETVKLAKYQVEALQVLHFKQILHLDLPKVECNESLEKGEPSVTFKGLPNEIIDAKIKMHEMLHNLKERSCRFPLLKTKLLENKKTEQFLKSKLEEDFSQAVWRLEDETLTVVAPTDRDLEKAQKVLQENLEFFTIDVPRGIQSYFNSEQFKQTVSQLENQEADQPVLVEYDSNISTVCISCLPGMTQTATKTINSFIKQHEEIEECITIGLPDNCAEKLFHPLESKISEIEAIQKDAKIKASLQGNLLSVKIKGSPKPLTSAKESIKALEQMIQQEKISITKPGMPQYFQSPEGRDTLDDLERSHEVAINSSVDDDLSQVTLVIYGLTAQSVSAAKAEVHQVCDQKSGVKVIGGPSSDPLSAVINQLTEEQHTDIMDMEKMHHIQIHIKHSSIRLEGTTSNLQNAVDDLTTFLQEVQEAILEEENAQAATISGPQDDVPALHECVMAKGTQVHIFKSDITKFTADVIVSACDKELSNSAGVSVAIARAAGSSLTDACKDYRTRNGNLQTSNVVTTPGGDLKCQHVLHALGPRWDSYRDKRACVADLQTTFSNVLTIADNDLSATSIVIPAISSGHVKVPKTSVAKCLYDALVQYDQTCAGKTSKLQHVYLVNIDQDVTDTIIQIFKDPNSVTKVPISPSHGSLRRSFPLSGASGGTSPTKSIKSFTLTNGLKVQIQQGDITTFTADVIITPSGDNLCHDQGVAAVIAKVAGTRLTNECADYIRQHGKLKATQIMYSTGGNLKCNYVIHAYGPQWNNYTDKTACCKDLMLTYTNCFVQAEDPTIKAQSIATPGISTGVFRVPKQRAAKSLYDALIQLDQKKTTLKVIYIVEKDKEFLDAIVAQFSGEDR